MDHLGRGPHNTVTLLLHQHCIENRLHPVLEFDVVVIWHQQIPGPVNPFLPERLTIQLEVTDVGRGEALDEILLDPTCCRDHDVYHRVLHQVPNRLASPGRDQVRGVPEKDLTLGVLSNFGIFEVRVLLEEMNVACERLRCRCVRWVRVMSGRWEMTPSDLMSTSNRQNPKDSERNH